MMRLMTVDPSRACYGVAVGGDADGLEELHAVRNLRDDADTSRATATKRLWPLFTKLRPEAVIVERPPVTVSERQVARRGGKTRGSQAVIGFGLGRAVELVGAWCYMHDVPFGFIDNGAWRRAAIGWMRQGLGERAEAPDGAASAAPSKPLTFATVKTARQPELVSAGVYRIAFEGCDHALTFDGWMALQNRPETCPSCAAVAKRNARAASVLPPSTERTGAPGDLDHKAPFVALARALYPSLMGPLISDARKRAQASTLDHELSGVADAADAALLWRYIATSSVDLATITG
jgi:hypothetical protein